MAKVAYNPLKGKLIENPQTIGEKIFNRRLELGLLQEEVAKIFDVCTDTITNWENNRSEPQIRLYQKVIEFFDIFQTKLL